ncbi:hypothetical protein QN277_006140 [Acacia crassicarpa]|uniref:Uncharacterized protein n=1 Tax=Acacia crassicarpa TaxID=499986 RepID=A0AAE1JYF8_9FABA|nr:hypothetical protein QN277_006140 [Acacia crassicarpa]
MSPQIKQSFMYLPTAKDIWVAVRDFYVDAKDLSQLFDLRCRIWKSCQGSRDVAEFWFELVALWQEEDQMVKNEWDSPADATCHLRNVDTDRILIFLAGLNSEFDDARARILSNSSLPPLLEVYSEIRREESRRKTMLCKAISSGPEASGFISKHVPSSGFGSNKSRPTCDHCKKIGHTKDKC